MIRMTLWSYTNLTDVAMTTVTEGSLGSLHTDLLGHVDVMKLLRRSGGYTRVTRGMFEADWPWTAEPRGRASQAE
jgi:hypothetical protein